MSELLIGTVLLIAGVGLNFWGLRLFVILLPTLGLISGFFLGASIVGRWLIGTFLSTIAEWIVGYTLGMAFAILSFLYWYSGVVLASSAVGAMIGMGIMGIAGVTSEWIIWVAAIIGAMIMAFLAFIAQQPVLAVILNTAAAGAIMIVTSISLVFRRVDLREVRWGFAWTEINVPWSSWLVLVVLAAAGVWLQWSSLGKTVLPEDRWMRADAAARMASTNGHRSR